MIARLINFYRRHIHRHPAATARRVEADRARQARLKRDAEDRARYMLVCQQLKMER